MRARVSYLARLAQQTAGQVMLRPPRRLFAGDGYSPVYRPDRDAGPPPDAEGAVRGAQPVAFPLPPGGDPGGVHAPQAPELTVSRRGNRGVARADGDLDVPVVAVPQQPIIPGAPASPAAFPTAPPSLPAPSAAPAVQAVPAVQALPAVQAVPAVQAGAPGAPVSRAASPATQAEPGDAAVPAQAEHVGMMPPTQAEVSVAGPPMASLAAADAARARPPATWPSALWDGPVDLPHVIMQPEAGETGALVTAVPPSRPATPATLAAPTPGPAPGRTGGPDPGRRTGGSAAPGARHQAPGQLAPPAPAEPGHLLPPPAPTRDPVPALGLEPSGPSQKPGAPAQPGVSIGTIEVTVVPPAPPVPERPRAQAARPGPKLAEGLGTGRLRDGLRRWYGTAQG